MARVARGRESGGTREPGARRCVRSRASRDRRGMIRFVLGPEDQVVPDLTERLPGRGLWLSADRSAISMAIAGHVFARALRRAVRVSPGLLGEIEQSLRRRCVETLGLARRAGAALAGYDRVVEGLHAGRVGLVVVARDAAAGQTRRIQALARGVPIASGLHREEMGQPLGRDEVTYVGLSGGALAQRLERDLQRLAGVSGTRVVAGSDEVIVEGDEQAHRVDRNVSEDDAAS
jgi:uncharacterized protein